MFSFLPTIILRHRKENLAKCTLQPLIDRSDLHFLTYPKASIPPLEEYVLLSIDAPVLSSEDKEKGIFLLDATWKYAKKMELVVPPNTTRRSLPTELVTAYPRKQEDCPDPSKGLASIEALFAAYKILGRPTEGLLDDYYWKDAFLELNPSMRELETESR